MAESDDESKTEEPSGKRLEEAARHGQVARSQEVTAWLLLGTATLLVLVAGPWIAKGMARLLLPFIENAHRFDTGHGDMQRVLLDLVIGVAPFLGAVFGAMIIAGVAGQALQNPPSFNGEKLVPDLARISPLAGIKRMFSMHSVVEMLKGFIKIGLVGYAIWRAIESEVMGMATLVSYEPMQMLVLTSSLILRILITVLAILFVIGILDYLYQRYELMKSLRMSKQELKDEYKEQEGDPYIKGRLKQLRQQRMRQRMMAAVPKADVVVTNPTHYAVALQYDPDEMPAPKVLAKGADLLAQRIRELAKEHEVPLVENPPLARTLHAAVEVDEFIPYEHYKAVAEVISYVFKLKGRMPKRRPTPVDRVEAR